MAEANIDTLTIEIQSESTDAVSAVDKLVESLERLKNVLSDPAITNGAKQIQELKKAVKDSASPNTKAMQQLKGGESNDGKPIGASGKQKDNAPGVNGWKELSKSILDAKNQTNSAAQSIQKMQDIANQIDWSQAGDSEKIKELQSSVRENISDFQSLKTQVDSNNKAFEQMGGAINSTSVDMGRIDASTKEARQSLTKLGMDYQNATKQIQQNSKNAKVAISELKRVIQEQGSVQGISGGSSKQQFAQGMSKGMQNGKCCCCCCEKQKEAVASSKKPSSPETEEGSKKANLKQLEGLTSGISKSFLQAKVEANKLEAELAKIKQTIASIDMNKVGGKAEVQAAIRAWAVANNRLQTLKQTATQAETSLRNMGATIGETSIDFDGVDLSNDKIIAALKAVQSNYDQTMQKAKDSIVLAKSYNGILAQQPKVAPSAQQVQQPIIKNDILSAVVRYMDLVDQLSASILNTAQIMGASATQMKLFTAALAIGGPVLKGFAGFLGAAKITADGLTGALGKLAKSGFDKLKASIASMPKKLLSKLWDSSIFHRFGEAISEAKKKYDSFKRSIAYSIIYRVLGASISMMTQSIKEGIENLYQYSRLAGTAFAPAMNSLATSALYLKNALATTAAPLIEAVAPAVDFLIDKFVALLNIIGKVFAALTGKSTFTQAKKHAVEYGDAIKGAEKAMKSFTIGIDELNIIEDAAGGAGSAMDDFGSMFEEVEIDSDILDWAKAVREAIEKGDWYGAGTLLADKLNEVVESWDARSWGENLGNKLNNAVDLGLGFMRTVNTENMGKKLADFINGIVSTVNWENVGALFGAGFNRSLDFFKGFLSNLDTRAIGEAIAKVFKGFFTEIDWDGIVETLSIGVHKIYEFLDGFLAELGTWTEPIRTAIADVEKDIQKIISVTKEWAENLDLGPLKEALGPLIAGFSELATILSGAFAWAWENILLPFGKWTIEEGLPVLIELFAGALNLLNAVLETVGPYLASFYNDFLKPIGEWIWEALKIWLEDAAGAFNKLAEALREKKSLSDYWDSLTTGEKTVTIFLGAVAGFAGISAILSNPIAQFGLLALGIQYLKNKMVEWYETSPTFRLFVDGIIAAFSVIREICGAVADAFDWVGEKIAKFFGLEWTPRTRPHDLLDKMDPALLGLEEGWNESNKRIENSQSESYKTQVQNATQGANDIAGAIGGGFNKILESTTQWGSDFRNNVSDNLSQTSSITTEGMNTIDRVFWEKYGQIDTTTSTGFNDINKTIEDAFGDMKRTADDQLDNLDTAMKSGYGDINSSTGTEWEAIVSTIQTTIQTAITDAPTWGRKIAQGIADGIEEGISDIKKVMNTLTSAIAAPIHHSEPDVGPLKDDSTYMPDMMKSFASGIEKNTPMVVDKVMDMAEQVSDGVTGSLSNVAKNTTGVMTGLASSLTRMMQDAVIYSVQGIEDVFSGLGDKSYGWGEKITSGLAQGIIEGGKAILDAVNYLANAIEQRFTFKSQSVGPLKDSDEFMPDMMTEFANGIESNTDSVISKVVNLGTQMVGSLNTTFTNIDRTSGSAWRNIHGGLNENLNKLTNSVHTQMQTMMQMLESIFDSLQQSALMWGQQFSNRIADGIMAGAEKVAFAASFIASQIQQRIGFSEPALGPLSNFHTFMPDMIELMRKGIESNSYKVTNAVSRLSQSVADSVDTLAQTRLTFPVHETVTVEYKNVQRAPGGEDEPVQYVDSMGTEAMTQAMRDANAEMLTAIYNGIERIVNSIDQSADKPTQVYLDGKRMDRMQEKRQRARGADIMSGGVTTI